MSLKTEYAAWVAAGSPPDLWRPGGWPQLNVLCSIIGTHDPVVVHDILVAARHITCEPHAMIPEAALIAVGGRQPDVDEDALEASYWEMRERQKQIDERLAFKEQARGLIRQHLRNLAHVNRRTAV